MGIKLFIFAGISGLNKARILQRFRKFFLTQHPPFHNHLHYLRELNDTAFETAADKLIPIIELCGFDKSIIEDDLCGLYNSYKDGCDTFRGKLANIVEDGEAQYILAHTHLANCIWGHYRSWLTLGVGKTILDHRNIEVRGIIHLIDNIYSCRQRLNDQDYPYTMSQVVTWRDIEQMNVDILSGSLFSPMDMTKYTKTLSVNHSMKTLADLIKSDKPHLYLAYPMSKIADICGIMKDMSDKGIAYVSDHYCSKSGNTGSDTKLSALLQSLKLQFPNASLESVYNELNTQLREFKEFFSKEFIAYDPGTIDEMPLLREENEKGEYIELSSNEILTQSYKPDDTIAADYVFEGGKKISIPKNEVKDLIVSVVNGAAHQSTLIERQIRSRDLRLIEQSQALVAYRPTLGSGWSRGVYEEYLHVSRYLHEPYILIIDKNDPDPKDGGSFARELGIGHIIQEDLNDHQKRQDAFALAEQKLLEQINKKRKWCTQNGWRSRQDLSFGSWKE